MIDWLFEPIIYQRELSISKLLVAFDIAWKIRNKYYRNHLLDKDLTFRFMQDFSFTEDEFFCRWH